jgi:hypothetical protein
MKGYQVSFSFGMKGFARVCEIGYALKERKDHMPE